MDSSPDPNNNTQGEKSYSLRPRAVLKREEDDTEPEESWRPRGRAKRRSKQKSLPLSKYRRKTANARERSRMREINEAFEALRRALPHFTTRSESPHEKTTKIMTLRLAMKYITALDSALRQADLDSDGESLVSDYPSASREHSLTPSSLSEHSDIFDQLFINSSFDDCPPSASSSSSAISPFLDGLKSPLSSASVGNKFAALKSLSSKSTTSSANIPSCTLPKLGDSEVLPPLTVKSLSSRAPSLPAYNLLATAAPQIDCYSSLGKDSLSPVDIQDYASTSWREFDCLPSPSMDLEDLFIT